MDDKLAFVDVDTQHDFMDPSGALYVPGAVNVADNIRRLVACAAERGIPLLSTTDAHLPDDPEFAEFGPHCVFGAPGQEKIPGTLLDDRVAVMPEPVLTPNHIAKALDRRQVVVAKRSYDPFTNPNMAPLVAATGARRFVVFGVATDYCVRAAALGLLERGYAVDLVTDAIRGITPEGTQAALDEMRKAGARFVITDQAVA